MEINTRLSEQVSAQRSVYNDKFAEGPRKELFEGGPLTRWLTSWRYKKAITKLFEHAGDIVNTESSVLVVGAADGYESRTLFDCGFRDVSVTDFSEVAVRLAVERDPRVRGFALNLEDAVNVPDNSFDIVVAQDMLHHLPRPVNGFTEMLRMARHAVIFLEPHDSFVGRRIGTIWEENNGFKNYVFRWTKDLVNDVTSSYLGHPEFMNLSFSFWHHNIQMERIGRALGGGRFAVFALSTTKTFLNGALAGSANQFCGMIVKKSPGR